MWYSGKIVIRLNNSSDVEKIIGFLIEERIYNLRLKQKSDSYSCSYFILEIINPDEYVYEVMPKVVKKVSLDFYNSLDMVD